MKEVNKKNYTFIKIGLILVVTSLILFYIDNSHTKKEVSITKDNNTNTETKKLDMEAIINNFNEFVIINNNSSIYKKEYNKYIASGISNGEIELTLDTNYTITDEYYKIANSDYYIFYQDTKKIDNITQLDKNLTNYQNRMYNVHPIVV